MELTVELARRIGDKLHVNWNALTPETLVTGAKVEMEHAELFPPKNSEIKNYVIACQIALAHLKERPDYYIKLADMERSPLVVRKPEQPIVKQEYKEVIESLVEEIISEMHFPPKASDYNKLPDTDGFWNQSIREAADSAGLHPIPPPFKRVADVIMWLNMAAQDWEHRAKGLGRK